MGIRPSGMQAGKRVALKGGLKVAGKLATRMVPGLSTGAAIFEAGREVMGLVKAGKQVAPAVGKGKGLVRFVSVGKKGKVGLMRGGVLTKIIRTGTTAHIGKNLPSHRMLTRLSRNLRRHVADAKLILRLVSPHSLKVGRRGHRIYQRSYRGHKPHRR